MTSHISRFSATRQSEKLEVAAAIHDTEAVSRVSRNGEVGAEQFGAEGSLAVRAQPARPRRRLQRPLLQARARRRRHFREFRRAARARPRFSQSHRFRD